MHIENEDAPIDDEIREASAIARRALALFAVVGLGLGAPREDTVFWLQSESLWDELSPEELMFFSASMPTERQSINASWRSEALLVLLWSLGKVEALPGTAEQCDIGKFQELLPPFAEVSVQEFLSSARRRPDEVLMDAADVLLNGSLGGTRCPHSQQAHACPSRYWDHSRKTSRHQLDHWV